MTGKYSLVYNRSCKPSQVECRTVSRTSNNSDLRMELLKPSHTRLELRTAYGPVFRDISTEPPRPARSDEIPLIDIGNIGDSAQERKDLAELVRQASENTGFFYIKNHGIPTETVEGAYRAAQKFFDQSAEDKLKATNKKSKHFNGFSAKGNSKASPSEGSNGDLLTLRHVYH